MVSNCNKNHQNDHSFTLLGDKNCNKHDLPLRHSTHPKKNTMTSPTSFLSAYQHHQGISRKNRRSKKIKPLITPRELEVLHLIAYEHSSKEIGIKLFISTETANTHRKNIMIKLGVKNTAGMVRVAFEKKLLPLTDKNRNTDM